MKRRDNKINYQVIKLQTQLQIYQKYSKHLFHDLLPFLIETYQKIKLNFKRLKDCKMRIKMDFLIKLKIIKNKKIRNI